ncbi:MAG: DUF2330 domain-containing protein [Myxococcota bacterium]
MDRIDTVRSAAAAAALVLMLAPRAAEACGGFFCDGGPQPMPVDQTGEDILFVMDEGRVAVHVRIEYEGAAENFAWLVPVLSVPTDFSVGSEALFDRVKAGSVPQYGVSVTSDDCDLMGSVSLSGGDTNAGGDEGGVKLDLGGGPVVLAEEQVGAYEIVVIGGNPDGTTTAQEVFDWLGENGYQQDEAALPILGDYLDEGHAFAALRLQAGAGVDALHPVVFEFDHPEPCVPLRLTAIAASDDMPVRTYFLSEHRVVPQTYKHVLVNPLKIDWPQQGSNYAEVVTKAVDADVANGRAFVTEYAGTSGVVDVAGLVDPRWDPQAFVGLGSTQVLDELIAQGLVACAFDGVDCGPQHPLLDALLRETLLPDDVSVADLYADPDAYADLLDATLWGDGTAFSQGLAERVVAPALDALDIVQGHPTLTRMFTIISPHEMTADPMFHENPDLDDVTNVRTGIDRRLCNGDSVWTLPDGREVYIPLGDAWPDLGGDMFWEEEVEEVPDAGPPIVLVDNAAAINEVLRAYNAARGWDGSGENGGVEGGAAADAEQEDARGGCGCRSGSGGAWAWMLLVALGLRSRRLHAARR